MVNNRSVFKTYIVTTKEGKWEYLLKDGERMSCRRLEDYTRDYKYTTKDEIKKAGPAY